MASLIIRCKDKSLKRCLISQNFIFEYIFISCRQRFVFLDSFGILAWDAQISNSNPWMIFIRFLFLEFFGFVAWDGDRMGCLDCSISFLAHYRSIHIKMRKMMTMLTTFVIADCGFYDFWIELFSLNFSELELEQVCHTCSLAKSVVSTFLFQI